jgi:hypothetical protein
MEFWHRQVVGHHGSSDHLPARIKLRLQNTFIKCDLVLWDYFSLLAPLWCYSFASIVAAHMVQ